MPKAAFRFYVRDGIIVDCADYGKKFLLGQPIAEAFKRGECSIIAVE